MTSNACYMLVIGLFTAVSATTAAGTESTSDVGGKVDAIFAALDKPDSPGCALGVIQDGKLVYARGYGMANLEHRIPNGPALVYDIGSTSKQITAASILLLAQQGKLALDDDVRKYIPEMPAYPKAVTIRHLLHHTSGVRDYLALFTLAGISFDDTTTEQDALDVIARQKALNFTPGEQFLYSNSGYLLLSIIIKRSSGKSFAQFAQENIFGPLGMKQTLVLDSHRTIVPARATGYAPAAGKGFQIAMSNFEQTGDGAVLTSIEDLLRWDQNFYDPKVGGQRLIDELQIVGTLAGGDQLDYASGLFIDEYKGLRRVSHGGAWAGYRAELMRFPDQKLSVACLCNLSRANPTALAQNVADIYLSGVTGNTAAITQSPQPPAAASTKAPSEDELSAIVGVYRSVVTGEVRRIATRDGKLHIDSISGPSLELTSIGDHRFSVAGRPGVVVEAQPSKDGAQLLVTRGSQKPTPFERVAPFNPSAQQLNRFAGSYASEELDTTYRLLVEQDQLVVSTSTGVKQSLTPAFRNAFVTPSGYLLEFNTDTAGKVLGYGLTAGRIRNVRFQRQSR